MEIYSEVSLVGVLATVSGCIVSLGIIYRGVVRPVFRWAQRLEKTMSFVEYQMRPNSGTSLRDSVDRIEERLTLVETYITNPR